MRVLCTTEGQSGKNMYNGLSVAAGQLQAFTANTWENDKLKVLLTVFFFFKCNQLTVMTF